MPFLTIALKQSLQFWGLILSLANWTLFCICRFLRSTIGLHCAKDLIQLLKGQTFLSLRSQELQRSQNLAQVMPSASRSFFDFAAVPSNPQSLVCQTQTVCLLRRGGWWWDEGEAVSGGSTLLRSSLDQGRRLDMNMGRSSPRTSQPVTLVQNGLTDSALAVSLAALCMYFMAGVERKRVVALFFFVLSLTGQRQTPLSSLFSLVSTLFPCWRLLPTGTPILSISFPLPSSVLQRVNRGYHVPSIPSTLYIPESIHSVLFSVVLLISMGGRLSGGLLEKEDGPEKSPKITVMQVDRQ